MYSDISTRIIACSLPKTASASALEISVLPTPVGPKNRNEPIGLLGSFKPTRPRLTAFATAVTASSWPTTRLCSVASNFFRRAASPSASFFTGIFVQPETTSATSSSVTDRFFLRISRCAFFVCFSSSASNASFSSLHCFASAISELLRASSNCNSFSVIWFLNSASFSVWLETPNRTLAAASSIRSIALSGKKRSLI